MIWDELSFRLTKDGDGWPPVSVEHLRVRRLADGFVIKSAPFFVKEISSDDVVNASFDSEGFVKKWHTVRRSNRTTIWLMETEDLDFSDILKQLLNLQCNIETIKTLRYHTLDVPDYVEIKKVDGVLDKFSNRGGFVVFPSFRH